jgi:hypothetical protein
MQDLLEKQQGGVSAVFQTGSKKRPRKMHPNIVFSID